MERRRKRKRSATGRKRRNTQMKKRLKNQLWVEKKKKKKKHRSSFSISNTLRLVFNIQRTVFLMIPNVIFLHLYVIILLKRLSRICSTTKKSRSFPKDVIQRRRETDAIFLQ